MKNLSAYVLLVAGLACGMTQVQAENLQDSSGQVVKKSIKKKVAAAKDVPPASEDTADTKGLMPTAFDCELGNKLTIYSNTNDDQQIALQWNKRLHRMTRVSTTTGAHRFENAKDGLVWIGIPAKGMLLDSKKGKQLANECKSPQQVQMAQQTAENQ
ncbi:MAG TPA: hypothetical protein VJ654_08365 [Noviherbaspirillum sp.]|nr:hypothetical protein [Noviherbaspirillum sp.]